MKIFCLISVEADEPDQIVTAENFVSNNSNEDGDYDDRDDTQLYQRDVEVPMSNIN